MNWDAIRVLRMKEGGSGWVYRELWESPLGGIDSSYIACKAVFGYLYLLLLFALRFSQQLATLLLQKQKQDEHCNPNPNLHLHLYAYPYCRNRTHLPSLRRRPRSPQLPGPHHHRRRAPLLIRRTPRHRPPKKLHRHPTHRHHPRPPRPRGRLQPRQAGLPARP